MGNGSDKMEVTLLISPSSTTELLNFLNSSYKASTSATLTASTKGSSWNKRKLAAKNNHKTDASRTRMDQRRSNLNPKSKLNDKENEAYSKFEQQEALRFCIPAAASYKHSPSRTLFYIC